MRKTKTRKSVRKEDYEDLIYYKLKNDRFKQQRLPAWRPVPTLCSIVIFYFLFALIFIAIGIVLLIYSSKIVTLEIPYNEQCKHIQDCEVTTNIIKDMKAPIMVYYKLEGFYQNHRRYVRSKSVNQIYGNSATDKGDCSPVITNKEMKVNELKSIDDVNLKEDDVAVPCGLMAKTFFNDTYPNWTVNDNEIIVNEKNIAFSKDIELYKNVDRSKQWIDMEDEHFIVWMRPAGLPNFRKLWGRIEGNDLKKGDKLNITIKNNYNVTHYGGDKSIILTTTNQFGGNNTFLGVSFIVVGVISLLLGIAFPLLIHQKNKNEILRKNS